MKKILALIFILIFSTTAYANNRLDGFNKWLFENGHTEYVNIEQRDRHRDEIYAMTAYNVIMILQDGAGIYVY